MSQTESRKTAEEKIAGFLKFGSRLGLERMTVLMDKLGNPQDDYDVILIDSPPGLGFLTINAPMKITANTIIPRALNSVLHPYEPRSPA